MIIPYNLQMKKNCFWLLCLLCIVATESYGQRTDKKLKKDVEEILEGFNGQAGVYIFDLKKNKTVAINADTIFSTASIVKIPIMIGVMDKVSKGELQYHQELVYKDSLLYAGVDILGSFKNNEKIELSKVLMLMLSMSDNTASLWVQSLAGTGKRINEIIDSLGFKNTRVNSRTPGREVNRTQYGWGQTTPREIATLLQHIAKGQVLGQTSDAAMLKLLSRNYWDEEGLSQIPAGVFVASKNGAVDASRSEVMYVKGNGREYVLCVATQNNTDIRWTQENEAWTMIRKIAALVWKQLSH